MGEAAEQTTAAVARIPLGLIDPGPNARGVVGNVDELAASLKAIGQQMPVIVEQVGDRYQLFDGHRRHAAAIKARLTHLHAIVRPADSAPVRRIVRQIGIQSQTERFSPMAEARALHSLYFEHGMAREDIARLVGKPPGWVRDRISLVHLEVGEQSALEAGRMSLGEALHRLASRRAMREGRPLPAPRARVSSKPAGRSTTTAAGRVCPTCHQPIPKE